MKTHARKQNLKNKFNKLYFFILIMCITCISNAQNEGWHLLPFVPSQTLWDIHCINKDTVIAIGDNGYIIRTTNGGSYWDSIYSTTTNTLYKVTFVNDSVGYICGKNGTVLKTKNSGLTWNNIGISTSLNLLSMSFINQDTGWIVGGNDNYPYSLYRDKGLLLKTCNGGENWDIDTSYTSTISSVCFIDNDTGYIALNNTDNHSLCKTTNGGLSFDTIFRDVYLIAFYYKDIVFLNPQTGYFLESRNSGGIYKTNDYGQTWHIIDSLLYPMFRISIIDSCNLFYNYWDNRTGTSYLGNTIVGINHCTNTKFDEVSLKNYGFNYPYLQIFGFDFINLNEGFCVGKGKKDQIDNIFILKKGHYDQIRDFKKNNIIKVTPNPCNDKTTLFFSSSFNLKPLEINIYNLIGQKIKSKVKIQENKIIIDLSKEKSGVYIVSIRDKNKIIENCKIIKL